MNRIFTLIYDILIFIGALYITIHIIIGVIIGLIIMAMEITMIPHNYCMCHKNWEYGEFMKTEDHFLGYGGRTNYIRPQICINYC